MRRAPGIPHALYRAEVHAQLGRIRAAGMWMRREAFLSTILSNGADALLPGSQPHLRVSGEDFEVGLLREGGLSTRLCAATKTEALDRAAPTRNRLLFTTHNTNCAERSQTFQSRYELHRFGLA